MAFTLNSGEYDLGAGFIGRGTILGGEIYSNTNIQGLLTTAGLVGQAARSIIDSRTADVMFFKESSDNLSGQISLSPYLTDYFLFGNSSTFLSDSARFYLSFYAFRTDANTNVLWSGLNSSTTTTKVIVSPSLYPFEDHFNVTSSNWKFLARDHATAKTQYPSTSEEGSIFAASYFNSLTQYGLWIAGAVGDRTGYFDQRQGDFALVILRNGSSRYVSMFSPSTANSSTRSDFYPRSDISPAPGESANPEVTELWWHRSQSNNSSVSTGTVPGFYFVNPNHPDFDSLSVGSVVTIAPGVNTVFEGHDKAIVVAELPTDYSVPSSPVFGLSLIVSNTGSLFTVTSAAPHRNTLHNGRRVKLTTLAPTGMAINTDYYVVNWNRTTFTFNLAATYGGSAIVPTSNETGVTLTAKAPLIAMRCY